MRLLLTYPVFVILFASISTATPPGGYVKRPNDDKTPPRYQYQYKIGDFAGKDVQGKMETRSGEVASGQYYVKGDQSMTDVKYFADEWGYHPFVKYRAMNDHSVATTHFALGEHVVNSLLNGSTIGKEVELSPRKLHVLHRQHRRRPLQLIQPYTPVAGEIDASDTGNVEKGTAMTSHDSQPVNDPPNVHSPDDFDYQEKSTKTSNSPSSNFGFQQHFHNYVTLPKSRLESQQLRNNDNQAGNSYSVSYAATTPTPDYRSTSIREIVSPLPDSFSTSNYDENRLGGHESSNDLYSTISDDILLVQNAGSFGRRLKPTEPSLTHEGSSRLKAQKKLVSSTSFYESTTTKPIIHYFNTGSELAEHQTSLHKSYTLSTTSRPVTSILYPSSVTDNDRQSTATPIPEFHDVQNSVGPYVTPNDYQNDFGNRDNAVTSAHTGSFAKIRPSAQDDLGERVNFLLTGKTKLLRYEEDPRNQTATRRPEILTTLGLSTYGKRIDHQLYVTLRQSLDTELRDSSNILSSTPASVSTFNSKPIVVAELSNYKNDKGQGFEYSTTFPCTDDQEERSTAAPIASTTFSPSYNKNSKTVLVTPKLLGSHSHITTSSVILNPIQAGVSLVNAGETELIAKESHGERLSVPVNESSEDEGEHIGLKNIPLIRGNELGKIVTENTSPELYETINPAFGQSTFAKEAIGKPIGNAAGASNSESDTALLDGNTEDQQIEIQKSVEIYQHAPVHEIHYPPEVITQVSSINQQHEVKQQRQNIAGLLHQRHEEVGRMHSGYAELHDAENAKQFHSSLEGYNSDEKVRHESHGTKLSLEGIRDESPSGASVYLANPVGKDNELVNYSIERNNGDSLEASGPEDSDRIIKLIRDSIPEVKYTSAKTSHAHADVYSNVGRINDDSVPLIPQRNGVEGQSNKVQSHLQRILSESEGVQRYFSNADWPRIQANDLNQQQFDEIPKKHGIHQVHESNADDNTRQPQQQQSILVPWTHAYDATNTNGFHQNLGNVVENAPSSVESTGSNPIVNGPIERIVEKTIRVPQPYPVEVPRIIEKKVPYPVEKIVERKVPFPVEKIVEKKIPVPQPYPVHIQVPVDRIVEKQVHIPYPVHIEKIIEKKVPYPVQKLVPQPYPVHIPYPVEKIIEKPIHIPVTVEKIVEKQVHVPHPYPVQVPIKVPYPVEVTKYVEQTYHVPYGVRYGVSYQQIMKPQPSNGLYGNHVSLPLYGLSLVSNHNRERSNASQESQGYTYNKPATPFITGSPGGGLQRPGGWDQYEHYDKTHEQENHQHQTFAKKSYAGSALQLPVLTYPLYSFSGLHRRQGTHRQGKALLNQQSNGKDEYIGPVPTLKQNIQVVRSRSISDPQPTHLSKQHPTAVTGPSASATPATSLRRIRQQDNGPHYQTGPGAFRQSKIEYGFKPPMVPSVQYDEKTASKVDK